MMSMQRRSKSTMLLTMQRDAYYASYNAERDAAIQVNRIYTCCRRMFLTGAAIILAVDDTNAVLIMRRTVIIWLDSMPLFSWLVNSVDNETHGDNLDSNPLFSWLVNQSANNIFLSYQISHQSVVFFSDNKLTPATASKTE